MNLVKLGETYRVMFGTSAGSGAATNADSLPVVTVRDQGTAMGYAPTVTNKATGLYEVALVMSAANGFTPGHEYTAEVAATVGGVTGRDGVASFRLRSATAVIAGTLTATAFSTNRTETATDHWKGAFAAFVTGALAGQVRKCTAYNGGAGKIWTFTDPFTAAPAAGDYFYIINGDD